MNLIAFVALSLLAGLASAQVPVPCTTPPQWEARLFGYDTANNDTYRARVSYDSVYKRRRVIEETVIGGDKEAYDILYLYLTRNKYKFNLKTKQCQKLAIDEPWTDFGIPQNATFLGESYLGSSAIPNANLLVTIWKDQYADEQGDTVNYMGVWTLAGCLPVSIALSSSKTNVHEQLFDITPGIANPDKFLPRPECLN